MSERTTGEYKLEIHVGFVEISDESGVLLRIAKGDPSRQLAGIFKSFGWSLMVDHNE